MKIEKVPDDENMMSHKGCVFATSQEFYYPFVLFLSSETSLRIAPGKETMTLNSGGPYNIAIVDGHICYRIVENED